MQAGNAAVVLKNLVILLGRTDQPTAVTGLLVSNAMARESLAAVAGMAKICLAVLFKAFSHAQPSGGHVQQSEAHAWVAAALGELKAFFGHCSDTLVHSRAVSP
jgi:hypothetical protein